MSTGIECVYGPEGAVVTKLHSTDSVVTVPEVFGGLPVTGIGPGFMAGTPGKGGRTLEIPGSVVRVDKNALEGVGGIAEIKYGGELEVFMSFGLRCESRCTLKCLRDGKPYSFGFAAGHPMSFPEFDEAVLNAFVGLNAEIALERLSDPVGLTESCAIRYRRFVSESVMPRAEQAVSSGNVSALKSLLRSGMVSDEDARKLLERSLGCGRVNVTSVLMSELRKRTLRPAGTDSVPAESALGRVPICI